MKTSSEKRFETLVGKLLEFGLDGSDLALVAARTLDEATEEGQVEFAASRVATAWLAAGVKAVDDEIGEK